MSSHATLAWPRRDMGLHTVRLDRDAAALLIGRRQDADVCIDDPAVSRAHAELRHFGGVWLIEDLGSTGGTFLRRGEEPPRPIKGRERLRDGDRIRVGQTLLRFRDPPAPSGLAGTVTVDEDTIVLTQREREILERLCADELAGRGGWPENGAIAAALFVTDNTVRTHLQNVYRKFGIDDVPDHQKRARLIRRAIQGGWV